MEMTQNKPLAGNDAVREYLRLLMEARPEAGREYAALLFQMDGMHRQLDAALKELAQVRKELAKMQECPEKGFLSHAMETAGKRLSAMRQGLLEMKERMVSGAREAVEGVKKSGIKALDKMVSAVGIRKGLEEMHGNLSGSIQDVKKSIEKVETVGRELRSVGGHMKNAGRAAMGREQQIVDGGTEGRFQAAILAPLRKEKSILDRINNLVLAAMGSVEHLEREAEKAREEKRGDRRETGKSGREKGADREEPDKPGRMERTDRDGSLQGEIARADRAKEPARAGNEPSKPSVLKDIQERKRENAARPASAPGRHPKQEAAL